MAFAFVIMGIVSGAFAAGTTVMLGGSIFLAILAYSGFGAIGATATVGLFVWLQSIRDFKSEQSEMAADGPVSA
jgi:hypothetical protein